MNKKTWFYGGLMVLFMLSSAYVVFTSASESWESEKGRCFTQHASPQSAPWPSDCGLWPICPDPYRTGTDGACWNGAWTGKIFNYNQSEPGYATERRRKCDVGWFGCQDMGVTTEYGSLNVCYWTFC